MSPCQPCRHDPVDGVGAQASTAAEEVPPLMGVGVAGELHGQFGILHQPFEGKWEAAL